MNDRDGLIGRIEMLCKGRLQGEKLSSQADHLEKRS
jgi:hypothetical protein